MAKIRPVISVIVPIYNVAPYLKTCLESILQQTYKELEIILVDDGSTDGCAQICDDVAGKDSRVIVIHQKNMGLVQARINGVNIATGDYATYVDGDDWIEKCTYEHLVCEMNDAEPDIITYALIEEFSDYSRTVTDQVEEGVYTDSDLETLRQKVLCDGNMGKRGVLSNLVLKIVKTDILKRCQLMVPTDVTIGEDALCTFAMFLDANSVQITWKPFYHYRRHNSSMMSNPLSEKKCIEMFTNLKGIANEYGIYSDYRNEILQYMYFLILLKKPRMLFGEKDNPYRISTNDDIVIYGAGEFGKELIACFHELGYRTVGWVDRRYVFLQKQGIDVQAIDTLLSKKFDYVLIAVMDSDIQETIKRNLCELGISENRIRCLRIDPDYLNFVENYVEKGREEVCSN